MKKLLFFLLLLPSIIFAQNEVIDLNKGSGIIGAGISSTTSGIAIGGGLSWYHNINDAHFTVTTIDDGKRAVVSGFTYALDWGNVIVGSAIIRDSVSNATEAIPVTKIGISTDTITFADWTSTFAAGDELLLYLGAPPFASDIDQNVLEVLVKNPQRSAYTSIEPIIDETGLDGAKAYDVVEMAAFQFFNIHLNIADSSWVKCYVTNNSAASDTDESSDWVDYSSTLFGADSIGNGTEGMYFQDTPFMPLKMMFRTYSPDDTSAVDGWIRRHY